MSLQLHMYKENAFLYFERIEYLVHNTCFNSQKGKYIFCIFIFIFVQRVNQNTIAFICDVLSFFCFCFMK